ncbi:DUF3393 domain-containing protein [Vibrio sp. HA2012]|uniref:transglycosylase SLT domain-containing protein n=1 Tax=Vibrio sp. HA2012 TaxID=1971595 RepID=UPI000C2B8DF2|nr:transglycosylase SLT domain-containing protein [Vibrio sp. HA2012]PJC85829.1 DUF3393 domain-containing protein [Vibrio sp. HA2012]
MFRKTALLFIPVLSFSAFQSNAAETLGEACGLRSSLTQCPSVDYYLNKPADFSDEFDQYKTCTNAEFGLFKAEQACEFDAYVQQAQLEFADYKKIITELWDNPTFSDKSSWVSYSPSMKIRREVDFEKNVVRITTLEGDTTSLDELKKEVLDTTKLSVSEAQKADPFVGKILAAAKPKQLSNAPLLPVATSQEDKVKEQQELLEKSVVTKVTDSKGNKVVTIEAPFPTTWLNRKEQRFIDPINTYADKFQLQPSFILSIIRTESAFDPTAVSHIPAFGLMQVVPTSAGLDATNYLFGEQQMLSKEYLFTPEKNIEVGSAYLYLLTNRYFKGVNDQDSLKYCAIAAYNGGMAPIYRIFGEGSRKKAIAKINTLSPDLVYQEIIEKHPAVETRNYLKKVTSAEANYLKKI